MTLTPKQLETGIEYFQILSNIQRRLIMEDCEQELTDELTKEKSQKTLLS